MRKDVLNPYPPRKWSDTDLTTYHPRVLASRRLGMKCEAAFLAKKPWYQLPDIPLHCAWFTAGQLFLLNDPDSFRAVAVCMDRGQLTADDLQAIARYLRKWETVDEIPHDELMHYQALTWPITAAIREKWLTGAAWPAWGTPDGA